MLDCCCCAWRRPTWSWLKHGETARVLLEQLGDLPRHEELADLATRPAALQAAATEADTVVQTLLAQEVPADLQAGSRTRRTDSSCAPGAALPVRAGPPGASGLAKSLLSAPSLDPGLRRELPAEIREASQRGDAEQPGRAASLVGNRRGHQGPEDRHAEDHRGAGTASFGEANKGELRRASVKIASMMRSP
ncbi:MAG: hypothetical protein U1E76_20130 [Planctomycetota bacterium]